MAKIVNTEHAPPPLPPPLPIFCPQAFREGFTITLVSGRTVGIGAYLARLGRRWVLAGRTFFPTFLLAGLAISLSYTLGQPTPAYASTQHQALPYFQTHCQCTA